MRDKIIRLELDWDLIEYFNMDAESKEYWKDEYSYISEKRDIKPIFNKDGMYYNRTKGLCWIECCGFAKEWNTDDFKRNLQNINFGEKYNEKLMKNLKEILFIHKLRDKHLLSLYYGMRHWFECRRIFRDTRKFMIRVLQDE